MLSVSDLGSFGVPPELIDVWKSHVEVLTDVQERAVQAGALDGHSNLLVVAPTTSGKTFVGEMIATSSAYTKRQHAIFIVPFRALADEHYDLFRQRYADLLSVVISTSDWTEFDADIRNGSFNLAVMTYEKLMAFLVQQPDLIGRCTALVVDEVQLMADGTRGANLEVLLTQVLLAENSPQIVALSASLDEVNKLDAWLRATLVISAERPVPLTQSVCALSGSALVLSPNGAMAPERFTDQQPDRDSLAAALAARFVAEGKQVIVFRTTVAAVLKTARLLRSRLPAAGLTQQFNERLSTLEDSDAINDLRLGLASGVGVHNADLTHPERSLVEQAFRDGQARALVATTTLAMGVNLPGDVVIVADSTRVAPARVGWSRSNITVAEYRNAAGRAGRLGQRSAGVSVLVAESEIEQRQLVQAYLLGQVEPVQSQIPNRPLTDVVFDIICAATANSQDGIVKFVASTFAYQTFYERAGGGIRAVREAVSSALRQCIDSGLVVLDEQRLHPTQLARVFGGAGLSLTSAAKLANVVDQATKVTLSTADLLFEVASCQESGDRPWLRRQFGVELDPRPQHAPNPATSSGRSRLAGTLAKPTISSDEMKALVRSRCLLEWISGKDQRTISAQFQDMGASAARIRELGKLAAWLLDSLADGLEAHGATSTVIEQVRTLALESRYGLPAPLAPLARLRVPGISRADLSRLYENGHSANLHDPERILDGPDDAFEGIITPLKLAGLRRAILADIEDSIRRRYAGQVARAEQSSLPRKLIDDLYTAKGGSLEQAVTDALNHVGLSARRILRQPHGEEDIQIAHADGTVIISVTASQDDARPIRWNKAKEILGAGAGINPINYVCIGRPSFESLAERSANDIARESGTRSILLVPVPALAEAIVRISEGATDAHALGNVLAHERGVLTATLEQLS